MSGHVVPVTELVAVARDIDWATPGVTPLSDAADVRTLSLIEGFVHEAGPAPARFAWVVFGSHARRELHCASDQDNALFWENPQAAGSSYAKDLAAYVIDGLAAFGMQRCSGGYMADKWSYSLQDWLQLLHDRIESPTPDAVVDTDVFLDLRPLTDELGIAPATDMLARGAGSSRLMHQLARAVDLFPPPRMILGRLPNGTVDVKKTGLAPIVLLARLYGLASGSPALGTDDRLEHAAQAGVLSDNLCERLRDAYDLLTRLRMQNQLRQIDAGLCLSDTVDVETLSKEDHDGLREAFRAIKSAQAVTSMAFRIDL